jgi:hypothetical protein
MNGVSEIGRYNTFEGGTRTGSGGSFATGQVRIYWSAATGAFEIYGDIRAKYLASGGPAGALGFPLSGETNTPGGGRFNAFQNGFIVWHANRPYAGAITVGNSLQLTLYSYQDTNHDDFNVQINITDSNSQVNHGRMPPSDNYGNGNQQFNPPVTLMSANALTAAYTMDVWMLCIHENTIGTDDEDGTVTAHYDIDNLWGTADTSMHSNASFNVNMKPMPQPQIFSTDPAQFRTQLFWPFTNFDTEALSWTEFSETFTNVGEGDLGFNVLPWNWHLWERAFFQFVYRGLAAGGNCFGMCLESIYAREFRTMFVEPIYNSPDNTYSKDPLGSTPAPLNPDYAVVVEQINIKMGYQVGSDLIAWFLGMEMDNQIQDAVLAFRRSRDAFASGNWPIIMVASSELSQDGHVVVPYQWLVSFGGAPPIEASDEAINSQPLSNQTWIMRVANPNAIATPDANPNDDPESQILIAPLENTWSLKKDNSNTWTGSQDAGRIFCAPFNLLSYEQAMVGDFIMGLLEGLAIVIFSSNGQTEQITDEAGRTYFSYAGLTPAGAATAIASGTSAPTGVMAAEARRINKDQRTRILDLTFVPTYHTTTAATEEPSTLPFEMYFIRRPVAGYRWPAARPAGAVALPAPLPKTVPIHLLHPSLRSPKLIFDLKVDRRAGYRWNLNCQRMSVDIASTTAVDAVDRVTITDPATGSQTITLVTDTNAGARSFAITAAGWRGNYGTETKVYVLKDVNLEAGASLITSVSDGGKELWVYNPGNAVTLALELYAGAVSQPMITRSNVTLGSGKIFRITPSDWRVAELPHALVYLDIFNATTGHLVSRAEL